MTGPVSPTGPPTTAGHSVLVVPIPALETFVAARHAHYDRDYVSADPTFAHAHVTILGPWLTQADLADPDRANAALTAVRDIASATRGFDIDFAHVDTFPNGIIHLVPEPAEPFAALTAAVYREFPAYPPYAGQFGVVQPHLTLDAVGAGVTEAVVREWVADRLPLRVRADRLHLSWYEAGRCQTLAVFPFGR